MRTYMIFAVTVLLLAGCGEGPLIPEDLSVISESPSSVNSAPVENTEGDSTGRSRWDPDAAKKIEEEEQEQEKVEENERKIESATDAIDEIGRLLNEENFDEAIKIWDDNLEGMKRIADEGMQHDNPEVVKLYEQWWEAMKGLREFLNNDEIPASEKSRKAIDKLVAAGRFKQSAKQMEIYER